MASAVQKKAAVASIYIPYVHFTMNKYDVNRIMFESNFGFIDVNKTQVIPKISTNGTKYNYARVFFKKWNLELPKVKAFHDSLVEGNEMTIQYKMKGIERNFWFKCRLNKVPLGHKRKTRVSQVQLINEAESTNPKITVSKPKSKNRDSGSGGVGYHDSDETITLPKKVFDGYMKELFKLRAWVNEKELSQKSYSYSTPKHTCTTPAFQPTTPSYEEGLCDSFELDPAHRFLQPPQLKRQLQVEIDDKIPERNSILVDSGVMMPQELGEPLVEFDGKMPETDGILVDSDLESVHEDIIDPSEFDMCG